MPKRRKRFGTKLDKLCGGNGYTYDMAVYLAKKTLNAASNITHTDGTLLQLAREAKGAVQKLFMGTCFSSPRLSSDLHNRKVNSFGSVHHNRQDMPTTSGSRNLKLKNCDIVCKVKARPLAECWKDTREEICALLGYWVVVLYRRFGKNYRSHLQVSRIPRRKSHRHEGSLPPHQHAPPSPSVRSFFGRRSKCINTSMDWELQ